MRKFLIKILYRLLDPPTPRDIDEEKIIDWLSQQRIRQGFPDYYKQRSYQILKTLGSGLEKEKYWIYLGQRYELLYLLEQIKKAERVVEKRKGRKNKK